MAKLTDKQITNARKHVARAIKIVGRQELMQLLDINRTTLRHWLMRDKAIALEHALKIAVRTNFEVRASDIRPDCKETLTDYCISL